MRIFHRSPSATGRLALALWLTLLCNPLHTYAAGQMPPDTATAQRI